MTSAYRWFPSSHARHILRVLLACLVGLAAPWTGVAQGAEIVVSAASSLTNAFTDIGKAFEQANPDTQVVFNFASSGQLLQQIARGAPVDAFASADQETMDSAVKQNLIVRSSRTDFARNTLVVVVPKGSAQAIAKLGDLQDARVKRIALGDPGTVPVGKYTKGALDAAGLFEALEPKFIETSNVRQSLDYVARGEVDAAFVYATDAAIMLDKVTVALEVPTPGPIVYPIAVVKGNGKEKLATKFVAFVRSEAARTILNKYGFTAAP